MRCRSQLDDPFWVGAGAHARSVYSFFTTSKPVQAHRTAGRHRLQRDL